MFYSEELSEPIFMKIAQKLAFESTKRSPCSDFQFSFFCSRYGLLTSSFVIKIGVKWLYHGPKMKNLKSEQVNLLVDSKVSFCAISVKISPFSFSE